MQVGSCCETYIDNQCPDCGSDNLDYREYDYGRDPETGYHDAGVRAICQDCGCNCDERDTEVKIGPTQFRLTPLDELPAPHRITSRPVCPSAPEFIRKEIA